MLGPILEQPILKSMLNFSAAFNMQTPNANSLSRQRRVLQIFNIYRIGLCIILFSVHSYELGYLTPSTTQPQLFSLILLAYAATSMFSLVCCYQAKRINLHAHAIVIIDVLVIALLTYISGGGSSGLGILLNITIVATGILLLGWNALIIAALASIAMLFQEVLVALEHPYYESYFLQVGVLGISYFATAILAKVLLSRLDTSEALLNQRNTDLLGMARLNQCILDRLYSGVIVVDRSMKIKMMNNAAGQLLNFTLKKTAHSLYELSPQLAIHLTNWLSKPQNLNTRLHTALSGPEVMVDFTIMKDQSGDAIILFIEDARRTAQQAQQMKLASLGQFTASMAHEIRNPLGAIAHAAQLLAESPYIAHEDLRLTQIMGEHVERVNVIIKNILQLSRRKQSSPHEINLYSWLQGFIDDFKSSQPCDITVDLIVEPENQEFIVCVDPDQIYQVLTNLCENSLLHGNKNSDKVSMQLLVTRHPESAAPILEVRDQGEIIPAKLLEKIFEPFFTTSRSGTGLGLYISKELCEANQARLDYVSDKKSVGYFRIIFYEVKHYAKTECIDS